MNQEETKKASQANTNLGEAKRQNLHQQEECDEDTGHDFIDSGNPQRDTDYIEATVKVPVKCSRCNLEAYELYHYSCTVNRDGEEVVS